MFNHNILKKDYDYLGWRSGRGPELQLFGEILTLKKYHKMEIQ